MESTLIAWSIPFFFVWIGLETILGWRRGRPVVRFQDAINSLSCGITQQVLGVGLKGWTIGGYVFVYETLRVAELDASQWWVWVAGVFAVDCLYYWFHRVSHRVGFIWAAHVVHHQSEDYNLTTALRQSALQGAMGAVFYWPLALIGLPPYVFVLLSTTNTLYQFWIHTRLIGRLGPLELFLNTPSHHRVHHGIDPKYVDKNYGGIFIVWDRLFGTFVREAEEPAYGTVKPLRSWNPVWANLEHWVRMARAAAATEHFTDKVRVFIAPPEWRPRDLGGVLAIPEVDHAARELYAQPTRRGLPPYVAAHFIVVALSTLWVLTRFSSAPAPQTAALVVWITASVVAWGGLFESRPWALPLELLRLAALPLLTFWLDPIPWTRPWAAGIGGGFALLSGFALLVLWRRPSDPREGTGARGGSE